MTNNQNHTNSTLGGGKAKSPRGFRKEVDCRRIYEPINLPYSEVRNILEVAQEVIPIIFVPAIMGAGCEIEVVGRSGTPIQRSSCSVSSGCSGKTPRVDKRNLLGVPVPIGRGL